MKHTKKRISKIVDELSTYLMSIGADDITVNIKNEKTRYKISAKSNYVKENNQKKIDKLIKCINCPKQEEMEEYYWELAGECDVDTELTLISMMVDKIKLDIDDKNISIVLYKNK
ncbi:hypothetical protein PV797_03990 [Clostridiaceae bacterium M8S5]|nr:hypothetical protein PV797_03990 [Clostridiaceae bacterium M8S5]